MSRAPSPFFTGLRPHVEAPAPSARKPLVRATVMRIEPVEMTPAVEELAYEVRRMDTLTRTRCAAQWCQRERSGKSRFCSPCLRAVGGNYARDLEDLELMAAGWTRVASNGWHWYDPVPPPDGAPRTRVPRGRALDLVRREKRARRAS